MSEGTSTSNGSSFASSDDGSSVGSENTDSRALNSLNAGAGEGETDDLDNTNKSFQEGAFATLYTLTKNKQLDASLRLAALKVVLEFLQIFRVLFNSSFPWNIQKDLWIFKAIQWLLFRMLVVPAGYNTYTIVFYLLSGLVIGSLLATAWIAVVMKGSDSNSAWLNRLVRALQLFAMVIYTMFWPAVLDFFCFLWDCRWSNIAAGSPPTHIYFSDHSCLAMPHMAHMIFAGVMCIIFGAMTLLMATGMCDLNPLTRSVLASADAATSFKLLALKMVLVVICSCLDAFGPAQVVIGLLCVTGVSSFLFYDVPYYSSYVNMVVNGLWAGLLLVAGLLTALTFTQNSRPDSEAYATFMTWAVLYGIFPAVALGIIACWLRMSLLRQLTATLRVSFHERKDAAAAVLTGDATGTTSGAVSMMKDLKTVHRWKDVEQVSLVLREMRVWDEDGVPDPQAAEFGEFVLKCAMARMPDNPALLVVHANFLIEVRKDGQAARTQMQLAIKANPSLLDNYNIFVAQQLAKALKRDGDGLDLLGYVEFQRNYRACVGTHKLALMAQRQFWNSLLRDSVAFVDLLGKLEVMEETEQRATATYRRVLERYPGNGKVLKVYGRFLEFVRNEPGTAAKYYEEALKQGTSESLLAMTAGQPGGEALAAAVGSIDEKNDGLVIINTQGIILMVNAPAQTMFGYDKGELEGKNVSVLMPPPFSTNHNSFLERFVQTGIPHIANKKRSMVALHKDRSMFPIMLCATRLSGVGADMLFIGLIRRLPPAISDGRAVVRFWTNSSGIILCCERGTADSFGLDAFELVGQPFSNLCTDVEGVNRFFNEANSASVAGMAAGADAEKSMKLRAQIMHSYLPPVDVELSIEFGGALDGRGDCRTITLNAAVLSESAATLVLDHKARVVYATDKLAAMLGYPVASLLKMELGALLPQPTCQLYKPWFAPDATRRITPSSCQAGGVVHILAANGSKLPVTLVMSTRDDVASGRATHIVQVTKATEATRLDQRRLLLSVNHKGTILQVNAGAPKALYGFEPSELVGKPLAATVDIFGVWRHRFEEDGSLLALLAAQAMEETGAGSSGRSNAGSASWRVGVHLPKRDRLRAACMQIELATADEDLSQQLLEDAAAAETVPVLQVSLYRADALSSVVELDKHLTIAHADDAAGLMFGINHKHMLKKSFVKLVGLPASTTFEDLLGKTAAATAKKGAMKTAAGAGGGTGASRVGQTKHIATACHLADGKPMHMVMQALSYSQGSKTRYLVRLQLHEAASSSLPALLQLKEGKAAAAVTAARAALAEEEQHIVEHFAPVHSRHSNGSDESDEEHQDGPARLPARPRGPPEPLESFNRTSDWVRETSKLPKSQLGSPDGQRRHGGERAPGKGKHRQLSEDDEDELDGDEAAVYVSTKHGKGAAAAQSGKGHPGSVAAMHPGKKQPSCCSEDDDCATPAAAHPYLRGAAAAGSAGPGSVAESASVGGASSINDGASEAAGSVTSASEGVGHDEDLAIDARRAKRLKKLNRMMQNAAAQQASTAWRSRTLMLLGVALLAHAVCFAVLTMEVDRRYQNAESVSQMAELLASSQQASLRAYFMQKCWMDEFQNMAACDAASKVSYRDKLQSNVDLTRGYHQMLYLGKDTTLQPFKDQRLIDYWTYKPLVEQLVLPVTDTGVNVPINGSRTLWEMGNVFVDAGKTLYFHGNIWKDSMVNTSAWQYVVNNGPGALYTGYAWTLDTFVDYTWRDLTSLSKIIIVLLVVEALVVQLGCMAYEFYLLQRCNVSHMRLFSVFLALPSATVRLMAARQLQVDDDSREEVDEDDMELAEAAAGGNSAAEPAVGNEAGTDGERKQKSVRMVVEGDDSEEDAEENADEPDTPGKQKKGKRRSEAAGRSSGKFKGKSSTAKAALSAAMKPPVSRFAALRHSAYKALFGWLDPKFKRNGKKLLASNNVLWRFMVPLLLWVAAVVVIFAVSQNSLKGLQGPLASLDLSAHVLYRVTRCRLAALMLGFSTDAADNEFHRNNLRSRLLKLRQEYDTLLYGGKMMLAADVQVTFDPVAPAAALTNADVADAFFKTTRCLRKDQSTCYPPDSEWYTITHSGIDAMMNRFLDNMEIFVNLPDELAFVNHTSYVYSTKVVATDLFDALKDSGNLFVRWTISRLESVKQLHIILLVISLACMVLFVMALYRPYARRLHRDSKAVAGLLSQLPAEVDVEGHVKTVVLGMTRSNGAASLTAGAGAPGGAPTGMPPGAFGAGAPGAGSALMLPPPAGAGGYGWQGAGPPAMWQGNVAGAWGGAAGR
uniref:PAS domain-containing protein n=1 Tax=Tetradesmus obliquus TaxID=3088 RepID=A0A383VUJ6_TETOB|eukprot:jgi/Sobl393_1/3114/SZX69178.1